MTQQNSTPALAPLREALEVLKEASPTHWRLRNAPDQTHLSRLFQAAEACGLLTEAKEPKGKLEVAVADLIKWGECALDWARKDGVYGTRGTTDLHLAIQRARQAMKDRT
jgi:hypothetical protein